MCCIVFQAPGVPRTSSFCRMCILHLNTIHMFTNIYPYISITYTYATDIDG